MKHRFRLAFTIAFFLVVMFVSAAVTLRLALHAGETAVPNFSNMTLAEAGAAALHSGLGINLENKFYSTTVPAGRILAQSPAAGSRVRHGWQVRVTESLGPQQVTIPDVSGQPERLAAIALRRSNLDLGTLAHLDAPGDPDMVLAQTPPPNAGVDQPRVSLLLSAPATSAASAFVLPSFQGMTYSEANHLANQLGLHVSAAGDLPQAAAPVPAIAAVTANGIALDANGQPIAMPVAPPSPGGVVTSQSPDGGSRAAKGDTIKLTFGH
jgi:beta-lactam-binding protein with PASTA domain